MVKRTVTPSRTLSTESHDFDSFKVGVSLFTQLRQGQVGTLNNQHAEIFKWIVETQNQGNTSFYIYFYMRYLSKPIYVLLYEQYIINEFLLISDNNNQNKDNKDIKKRVCKLE